ncbi:hypothetical protein [Acidovorax sp. Leaf78]|uniref:hypothetical protein n=1 Tax=Acidovorax sp. Leaf78 TaxID=1736237 RepID=UPI0006F310B7|nr:hypothetical protein [Acidovorax sp. Leaf78]KQO23476.1 hypothetical protein ASF16_04755 [Acidovorax sp. Leaf78]
MQITTHPDAERGQQFTLTAETDADRELVDAIDMDGPHALVRKLTHRAPSPDGAGYINTGLTLLADRQHPQALEIQSGRQLLRAARELFRLSLGEEALHSHIGLNTANPDTQEKLAALFEKLHIVLDAGVRAIGQGEGVGKTVDTTHGGLLCSCNASQDSAPATLQDFAAAFTAWEQQYRNDPSDFMTAEECRAAEVAEHGERCAIYFNALLRQVRTPA